MKWLLLAVFVLSASSKIAIGETKLDGNELLPACQATVDNMNDRTKSIDPFDAGYCMGLVHGVSFLGEAHGTSCDVGVSLGQEVRVVVKYLNDHPAELDEDGAILVAEALHRAWPCPNKK